MNHFHLVELLRSRSNLQTSDRCQGLGGTESLTAPAHPLGAPFPTLLLLAGVVGQVLALRPCLSGLGEPPQLLVSRELPAPVGSLVIGPTTSPTRDTTNNLMPVTKPTQNLQYLNQTEIGITSTFPMEARVGKHCSYMNALLPVTHKSLYSVQNQVPYTLRRD